MKKLLLVAAACLTTGVANAEQWYFVNLGATNFYLIDMDSRVCDNKICSAWQAVIPTDLSLPYDLTMMRFKVDCSDYKLKVTSFARYSKGKLKGDNNEETEWFYASPGSAGEPIVKAVCVPSSIDRSTGAIDDIRSAAPTIQGVIAELSGKSKQ